LEQHFWVGVNRELLCRERRQFLIQPNFEGIDIQQQHLHGSTERKRPGIELIGQERPIAIQGENKLMTCTGKNDQVEGNRGPNTSTIQRKHGVSQARAISDGRQEQSTARAIQYLLLNNTGNNL
jgi:hypothetical protein